MKINDILPLLVISFISLLLEMLMFRIEENIENELEESVAVDGDLPSEAEGANYLNRRYTIKNSPVMLLISLCVLLGTAFFLKFYYSSYLIEIILTVTFIALLCPVSVIDYKKHLIPNQLIIAMLVVRLVIFAGQLMFDREYVMYMLVTSILAALGMMLAAGLCRAVSPNSVGMGDVKLLGVTGLYMGLDKIGGMMFPTLILMFFVSLYLLLVKKVSSTTEIAFAPYLFAGTILGAFLMGV